MAPRGRGRHDLACVPLLVHPPLCAETLLRDCPPLHRNPAPTPSHHPTLQFEFIFESLGAVYRAAPEERGTNADRTLFQILSTDHSCAGLAPQGRAGV